MKEASACRPSRLASKSVELGRSSTLPATCFVLFQTRLSRSVAGAGPSLVGSDFVREVCPESGELQSQNPMRSQNQNPMGSRVRIRWVPKSESDGRPESEGFPGSRLRWFPRARHRWSPVPESEGFPEPESDAFPDSESDGFLVLWGDHAACLAPKDRERPNRVCQPMGGGSSLGGIPFFVFLLTQKCSICVC